MPSLVETVTNMMKPKGHDVVINTVKTDGTVITKKMNVHGDILDDPYGEDAYDTYWRNRSYGYSYGAGSVSYTPPTPSVTTTPPYTRKVEVVFPSGASEYWTIPFDGKGWWDIAKTVWPVVEHKQDDIMSIPAAHCEFSYGEPKFNACVYTGTTDYLQARWGRKLDDSDRRWLAAHPFATDGGIPQEYTATCIDQLATPYGMRVSRIRIRKGALVLGDSLMGWLMALGCNPLAFADRATSNADAAQQLGIPLDQANQLWRVEFHDEPLPCSIVGERGWTNSSGIATGSFGGHCRYLAPRAKPGDWFISVQLDMDTQVSYLVPPPNPEYIPRKGDPTLLYTEITGPDNTLVAIKVNGKWTPATGGPIQPATTAVTAEVTTDVADATGALTWTDQQEDKFWGKYGRNPDDDTLMPTVTCATCASPVTVEELYAMSDVCMECAEEAWQGLRCPHCDEVFGQANIPYPIGFDARSAEYECDGCRGTVTVPTGQFPFLDELTALVFEDPTFDPDMPPTPEVLS